MGRYAAVGVAYLRWAIRNPTHFQIIATRRLIDWDSSVALQQDNAAIRVLIKVAMGEVQQRGLLRSTDVAETCNVRRALVYGLVRMVIDGPFAQWGVDGEKAEQMVQKVLQHFMSLIEQH